MILAAIALAAAAPAARPEQAMVGRYAVRSGKREVCTLRLFLEPDVGGEVEPARACPAPLADAALWSVDGQGGLVLRNPIRQTVARVTEDEAGYTLALTEKRRFDLVRLDGPRLRTDAERARGWWSVRGDDPAKVLCRIELRPGGAVGPATGCPAALKPYGGGRWRADTNGVRLQTKTGALALRWGDAVSLIGPRGALILAHD